MHRFNLKPNLQLVQSGAPKSAIMQVLFHHMRLERASDEMLKIWTTVSLRCSKRAFCEHASEMEDTRVLSHNGNYTVLVD